MVIIDHLITAPPQEELAGKESDSLILTSEQRRWARGRFTTSSGRDVALALPTGATLEPGAIMLVEQQWYLAVQAAGEPVLSILPGGYESAVTIAFEVGNRHFPLALDGGNLLVPDDPAMVQLLERLGAPWERRRAAFNPIGKMHRHEHT